MPHFLSPLSIHTALTQERAGVTTVKGTEENEEQSNIRNVFQRDSTWNTHVGNMKR